MRAHLCLSSYLAAGGPAWVGDPCPARAALSAPRDGRSQIGLGSDSRLGGVSLARRRQAVSPFFPRPRRLVEAATGSRDPCPPFPCAGWGTGAVVGEIEASLSLDGSTAPLPARLPPSSQHHTDITKTQTGPSGGDATPGDRQEDRGATDCRVGVAYGRAQHPPSPFAMCARIAPEMNRVSQCATWPPQGEVRSS